MHLISKFQVVAGFFVGAAVGACVVAAGTIVLWHVCYNEIKERDEKIEELAGIIAKGCVK